METVANDFGLLRTHSVRNDKPSASGWIFFVSTNTFYLYFLLIFFFTVSSESVNQNFHFLSPKMASNSSSVRVISDIEVLRALRDLRGHRSLPLFRVIGKNVLL